MVLLRTIPVQNIVISATVTKIDAYAFKNCSGLQQVLIGDGVKEIGEYAFDNCNYMQRVQIKGDIPFNSCQGWFFRKWYCI